jgi:hypothetical protein
MEHICSEVQMADEYMRKCSTSIAIKEMQIQTTLKLHLIPVRMGIMMKRKNKC